ncbi:bifunctional 2-keto-4-hydroxyglutarate aldolase/2-keto-3-deoxy-6-phosphogluconate aldolase [Desulfurispora thermophila]|uniref:bifunctional 2-keto-4-hydroxyglutarate aldolase/2-keto-3-deoxy-6-phosphogluconate aldolase n=1 Tax=Desulfurispora thermophila TaxID=265470 RepID=UPI000366D11A|nr:bifunctional 2-keto-4-hydroxyglutarate aldolase/2-keto-3-deoxy-6-phosphogluconate aldolase [Desulfurispora thermophila]
MLKKHAQLNRILEAGIVAVIRADNAEKAMRVIEAVRKGGIPAIEVTMTVPGAIEVIRQLATTFSEEEMLIGAGTVLDPETARACILAGAQYIVSPGFNPDTVRLCNRYQKICMPGCTTVTEILAAMELGVDVVKLFPGELFGPQAIKAIRGPLPQANIMPTGGVSLDNVEQWIKAGAVAVGVGSDITKQGLAEGNYDLITEKARAYVEKIARARGRCMTPIC